MQFKEPIAYVCSYHGDIGELVSRAYAISNTDKFVIPIRYDARLIARLLPAYLNARARWEEGSGRVSKIWLEMMMLACMTGRIEEALRDCGARKGRFIAFATDLKTLRLFLRSSGAKLQVKCRLRIDYATATAVALSNLPKD